MKQLFFLLFCVFGANLVHAQQLNLKVGEEFTINTQSLDAAPINKDGQYTFHFKVITGDNTGYKLQCTLLKANIIDNEFKNVSIKLNTDSVRSTKFNSTDLLMPLIILQKSFFIDVNPNGTLLKLEGYDDLVQQAIANWHLTNFMQTQLKTRLKDYPLPLLKNLFFNLPAEKIGYGSTWVDKDNVGYTVTTIRDALLDITAANPAKTSQANYVLNTTNGLLEHEAIATKGAPGKIPQQNNYSQTLIYGANTTPVADTAWINMAITLSFFSDALKSKTGDADSAKVFGYFAAHDALYSNDAYYRCNKLTDVQQIRGKKIYMVYDTLLSKTPNKFIAGQPAHLFNKIYMMQALSADSAYDLVQYFYKEKSFGDWVHQSYAQFFLPKNEDQDEEGYRSRWKEDGLTDHEIDDIIRRDKDARINAYVLLDMLHKDKNPICSATNWRLIPMGNGNKAKGRCPAFN